MRILVADDDPAIGVLLRRVLERAGYFVDFAPNAELAIDLAEKHDYDALLTDVSLPGRSGLELLQVIRAAHPWLPAVLVTAHADVERPLDGASGYTWILPKPFSSAQLVETLATVQRNSSRFRVAAQRGLPEPFG